MEDKLLEDLIFLYGINAGYKARQKLKRLIKAFQLKLNPRPNWKPDQRDAILITYPDLVQDKKQLHLKTLNDFLAKYVEGLISTIHILPFFPWSSDDGFSVSDYRSVDGRYGSWEDIQDIRSNFRLMFDAVINHTSSEHAWFRAFLGGETQYQDYYIAVEGNPDLSMVVRPRTSSLLTHFPSNRAEKRVWTTFSADQVDLNYHNPDVLLEIIDVILYYLSRGASLIRLDAVAYLWKEIGTSCIHRPQTYRIVQLFRYILDEIAPSVQLITETNVPHKDNLSYFGNGTNMAGLVYNFTPPPLILHTLLSGSSQALNQWMADLVLPSENVTFLNFLASHDGIGVNPLREILSDGQTEALVKRTADHGGLISHKTEANGNKSPYELNINYFDALSDPNSGESLELQILRFLCAHAILFSMRGIPGIYFHSLFGSRSWPEGVRATGRNRTINREKLQRIDLERELSDPSSLRAQVFHGLARLLKARSRSPAFDPYGNQRVLEFQPGVFALLRYTNQGENAVLCVHNITANLLSFNVDLGMIGIRNQPVIDLIHRKIYNPEQPLTLTLEPYHSVWLTPTHDEFG